MEQHPNTRISSTRAIIKKILECMLNGIFLQRLMAKVLVMALVAQLNALLQELACKLHVSRTNLGICDMLLQWTLVVFQLYPDTSEVSLTFLHPHGPSHSFRYPREQDILTIKVLYVLL